jgi:hypothetical protein
VFLDAAYQPTIVDTGRMVMFVENYADAEGVLIMAEMPGNHPDNGVIVRVINSNNNSLVSMIFPHGSSVPSRVAITLAGNGYEEGMEITGDFTFHNLETGEFSVKFDSEGETETLSNLFVNRDILDAHEDFTGLTRTQNVRLRSIFTTMAIWDSIAYELEGEEDEISARIFRRVRQVLSQVFTAVAIVATFVVAATAPIFPAVSAASAVVAVLATWVAALLYYPDYNENHSSRQAENPEGTRPRINIVELRYPHRILLLSWFDQAENRLYCYHNLSNARYFDLSLRARDNVFTVTVTRNNRLGFDGADGKEQLVIRFVPYVIINGVDYEGYRMAIQSRHHSSFAEGYHVKGARGNIFLVNFSAEVPRMQGGTP